MRIDLGRLLKGGATVTAVGSALFGATAAGIWWQLFRRPLPKTEGELRVTGLEGEIEISRDRWGMPRIRAANPHDLWFGQGFCHGQDRLWQCDMQRRIERGMQRLIQFKKLAGRWVRQAQGAQQTFDQRHYSSFGLFS